MAALMELDETLCRIPVCQHPQCWVTCSRIRQGHPRYRPLGSITRTPPIDPVGLPVLSVTTLPNNQTLLTEHGVRCASSSASFIRMSSPSTGMHNLYNSATCSMDKILFPGMNSYSEITAIPRRVASILSSRKPWQVATVDPCIQNLKTKHKTMVWVPNSQQKSQELEKREKPLKVPIKELKFTDVSGQQRRGNLDLDVPKIRKTSKPPTGGRPHNLILANSPTQTHSRKSLMASSLKENSEKLKIKRRSYEHYPYSDSQHVSSLDSLVLENRRVVLHDNRSKHHSSPTISQSGPLYKLDEQNLEALNGAGIDLNLIRNQYYLWKKYIGLAGPSFRIQPPGSVVCDSEGSHDLDSRYSPSSAGFSQTSWAEVEPFDAPADLDPRRINEEDIPGEQADEAESNQLQEDMIIPQEIPDIESEHFLKEEESLKEYELTDKSEPMIQGAEVSNGQDFSEQITLSPQPNPPPPSPTQESIMGV
ncbi:uncharacterized protein C9orf43 homolog [Mantella aurantiaca]